MHDRVAIAAHYASLAVGFPFLLWVNRHHWFVIDDWYILMSRTSTASTHQMSIWAPYNDHWATLPILVYKGLFRMFGVRTYLPYLVALVLSHLAVLHLVWRVMRRAGSELFIATGLTTVLVAFGTGYENLLLAWQITFLLPLALGLGALLLVRAEGPWGRRDLYAQLLLLLAITGSGVGTVMVAVVGAFTMLRRGWRTAAITVSVPSVVYAVWYAVYSSRISIGQSFTSAASSIPSFLWKGLTGIFSRATDLGWFGPVALGALTVWLVLRSRKRDEPTALVTACAGGAVLFLVATAIGRSYAGSSVAESSRYLYVVFVLALPAVALALSTAVARLPALTKIPTRVCLLVVFVALMFVQIPKLTDNSKTIDSLEQPAKRRIVATAVLSRFVSRRERYLSDLPFDEHQFLYHVSVPFIEALDHQGKLPGNLHIGENDVLDARVYLQLAVSGNPLINAEAREPKFILNLNSRVRVSGHSSDCYVVTPTAADPAIVLRFDSPGRFLLSTGATGPVVFRLHSGLSQMQSTFRPFAFVRGRPAWVNVSAAGLSVIAILPRGVSSEFCGAVVSPS